VCVCVSKCDVRVFGVVVCGCRFFVRYVKYIAIRQVRWSTPDTTNTKPTF
jgi:hypothetical protein